MKKLITTEPVWLRPKQDHIAEVPAGTIVEATDMIWREVTTPDGLTGFMTQEALKDYKEQPKPEPPTPPAPNIYAVQGHVLLKAGVPVPQKPSPNHGGTITPTLIVVHYTGDDSLQGALSWLTTPVSKVSAHLVIAKDGTVFQLLPFNVQGWHAGVSSYHGRSSCNNFSIGIENVGVGKDWPAAQVQANRDVISALCFAYGIKAVAGHCDVAPGRKQDPGSKYPWAQVTEFYKP